MPPIELTDDIRRLIGQRFVFGLHGKEIGEDVRTLIRDYHVGHFILMKRNVKDALQTRQLLLDLQSIAKEAGHSVPLLIGTDQENGLVSPTAGTQYPGAMAISATGSVEIAEEVAQASGKELAAVGIHWAYSPVADVNSNPRNPVIGVRSFGDDPDDVAKYAIAVSRGLVSSTVASCAKHFPGHGDTHVDSHLALPVIPKTLTDLRATELVPFKALVSSGVPSIMTSHVALPEITGDLVPSSLSRTLTTGLLRKDLGYEGIIVTDCLEMDAVMKEYGSERAAVEALKAGADIAMICHTLEKQVGAIKLAWEAVEAGELSVDELLASGERIRKFKDKFAGTWNDLDYPIDSASYQPSPNNYKISQNAYRNSVTVISDLSKILPLSKEDDVVLFTPAMESLNRAVDDSEDVIRTDKGYVRNTAGASYLAFAASIARRARSRHVVYDKSSTEVDLDSSSSVIFTLRNADRSTWQIDHLRLVLNAVARRKDSPGDTRTLKVVIVSSCTPYDLLGVSDIIAFQDLAYVATFEFTAMALETAAELLFGEIQAKGRVPVLGGQVVG